MWRVSERVVRNVIGVLLLNGRMAQPDFPLLNVPKVTGDLSRLR
jgi:hypothetical protein